MATSGNLMAEDFVRKLEHHLKSIVKACEGDKHWPEKYKAHFKVRHQTHTDLPPMQGLTTHPAAINCILPF